MTSLQLSAGHDVDFITLKQELATELKEVNGSYYCTVRGLGRLLDISPSCLTDKRILACGQPHGLLIKLMKCSLEELPETLKPIAGLDYTKLVSEQHTQADGLLSEIVVSCIIKYYAYEARVKRTRAVQLDNLLSAVGVRHFFATILGNEGVSTSTPVLYESEEVDSSIDNRLATVKEVMSVLANAAPEFQEKALLTLLGVL